MTKHDKILAELDFTPKCAVAECDADAAAYAACGNCGTVGRNPGCLPHLAEQATIVRTRRFACRKCGTLTTDVDIELITI